jgi:hypothetical protein
MEEPRSETLHELSLGFRIPILGGENNNRTSDKWSDVYNAAGFGFFAQYSPLFKISPVVHFGPYVGFSVDVFDGQVVEQGFGSAVDVDPIAETRLILGARVREQWGAFFMDQNIGFGVISYGQGTGTINFFNGDNEIELIESSTAFAFEIGLRLGAALSRRIDLGLGFTGEFNGGPQRGKDIADTTFEFKGQANFVISLLININF